MVTQTFSKDLQLGQGLVVIGFRVLIHGLYIEINHSTKN